MAPQSNWSGFLKLSLVACPVRLQPATTRANRITFHNLDPDSHARIEMHPHDAESGDEIDRGDLVRGFEVEPGRFILIEDEDLDSIAIEASRTIDLTTFVDRAEIDPIYCDTPYFIVPDGPVADETFRVIRDAMRRRNKAGLGHVVLANRERVVAVYPRDRGMVLITLRSAEEVRGSISYFGEILPAEPDPEMVALAKKIIEQKRTTFDPARFEDRHQAALSRLIESKMRGEKSVISDAKEAPSSNVIDLMAALKRSLHEMPAKSAEPSAGERAFGRAAGSARKPERKPARKSSGRATKPNPSGARPRD